MSAALGPKPVRTILGGKMSFYVKQLAPGGPGLRAQSALR
jgi:hypothetical protein